MSDRMTFMNRISFEPIESHPIPAAEGNQPLGIDIDALARGLRAGQVAFLDIEPTKRNQSRVRAALQWKGLRTVIRREPDGLRVWANGSVKYMPDSSPVPKW